MGKNRVRLTESQLHNVIKESVKRVINEIGDTPKGQYMLGRLMHRYGEDSPNVSKAKKRKEKDIYPIFNYAEKSWKKAGGKQGDNKALSRGLNRERRLERFDNASDYDDALMVAACSIGNAYFLKNLDKIRRGEYVPALSDMSRDELRKLMTMNDEDYFPNT